MKPELFLQCEFARWLDSIGVLYCASAGGVRTSMVTAINLKRSGYRKGVPDIFIYEARGKYHGLGIELKVNSGVKEHQRAWQEALQQRGYCSVIMPRGLEFQEGLNWLKKIVEDYLNSK